MCQSKFRRELTLEHYRSLIVASHMCLFALFVQKHNDFNHMRNVSHGRMAFIGNCSSPRKAEESIILLNFLLQIDEKAD